MGFWGTWCSIDFCIVHRNSVLRACSTLVISKLRRREGRCPKERAAPPHAELPSASAPLNIHRTPAPAQAGQLEKSLLSAPGALVQWETRCLSRPCAMPQTQLRPPHTTYGGETGNLCLSQWSVQSGEGLHRVLGIYSEDSLALVSNSVG